ncbi:Bacterial hemoglobin [Acaryochloris thomasi RCC1774]|uniref:Bacterial hemoglobin n=1 Tax=Acaryochloris thomasi RCC1774 TaxID=1764569 RepID=A0A2W1K5I4_9CYAN|nr:globin family protein [Acaryochloris thomasi]PZD75141.1 Bacterial hemoglobin [Acaryochloris thomasi RCC1774]
MSLQVETLERSFDQIKPMADDFVTSFYDNLFTDYPAAEPLFAGTAMEEQKPKLLKSLVLVIQNLRNPEILGDALEGLGARHVKYGALPQHYPLVGNSLLKTFEQYLGKDWTPEVKQAWVDAYGAISETMLAGADYNAADLELEGASAPSVAEPDAAEHQVQLLEKSFAQITPEASAFVGSFYTNLFTDYPAAKPLFENTHMKEQEQKLLQSLVLVIENLRNPEVLSKSLRGLGARHVKYGALPEHYPLVGNSLLKTFEQYLGQDWRPEVKEAWVDAYGTITEIMLDGADYTQQQVQLETSPPAVESPTHAEPVTMANAEGEPKASVAENLEEGSEKGLLALIAGGVIAVIVIALLV